MDSCARALYTSLTKPAAIFSFAAELVGTGKESVGFQLLARMKTLQICSNCSSFPCAEGTPITQWHLVHQGLQVRANPDCAYMIKAVGRGSGKIKTKNSGSMTVRVVTDQDEDWMTGQKFQFISEGTASLRFACSRQPVAESRKRRRNEDNEEVGLDEQEYKENTVKQTGKLVVN